MNDNFENIYINLINETNDDGIKTLYLPNEIKKFNFKSFKPFIYNNVSVFQSALHNDINHVINRLNERSDKIKYTLTDIFIIIKRGINEYLKTNKTEHYNSKQSFNIISRSYPEIKIACAFEINNIKDQLIYLPSHEDNILYHSDYFCFVYTVLLLSMKKHYIDKELIVENCNNLIDLYVD